MISIVVLNYNRLECTKQTIQSLIDNTTVPHEFIFVDNGSIDGTREFLQSIKNKTNAEQVKYVFNKRNFGVAGGRNSGLREAEGDYLLTIDDDILVPPKYDVQIIDALDNIRNLGMVGVSVEKKHYPAKTTNGVKLRLKKGNIGGACICFTRKTFEKVGYFSPDFVYGGEDCDMYTRMSLLGLINGYVLAIGKHLSSEQSQDYMKLKKQSHKHDSEQQSRVRVNKYHYKKGIKDIYVPYKEPEFKSKKFDKAIRGSTGGSKS